MRNKKGQFMKGHIQRNKNGVNLKCQICGKKFYVSLYLKKKRKNCSIKCYGIFQSKNRIGKNHPGWKGEQISYSGIHRWQLRTSGNPPKCEMCGKLGEKRNGRWTIEWALLKGKKHERKRENYWGLCVRCHHVLYDKSVPSGWLKGKKRWWKAPGAFKKGLIPWNKGTKGIMLPAWNKGIKGKNSHMFGKQNSLGISSWNKGRTKIDFPQLSKSGVKKGNIPWNKGLRTGKRIRT